MKNIRIILLILTVVAVGLLSGAVSLPAFVKANSVLLLALCVLVWIFLEIWNHNPSFQLGVLGAANPNALRRFFLAGSAGLMIAALAGGIAWFTIHHVTVANNANAHQIIPTGNITEFPIPTANSVPSSITTGPDGNLWFTESYGNKIGRISPSGHITEFPVPTPSYLAGITVGPDGNLWFIEDGQIGRISRSGSITEFPVSTNIGSPDYITTGPDGNLWFTGFSTNKIGYITLGK